MARMGRPRAELTLSDEERAALEGGAASFNAPGVGFALPDHPCLHRGCPEQGCGRPSRVDTSGGRPLAGSFRGVTGSLAWETCRVPAAPDR